METIAPVRENEEDAETAPAPVSEQKCAMPWAIPYKRDHRHDARYRPAIWPHGQFLQFGLARPAARSMVVDLDHDRATCSARPADLR